MDQQNWRGAAARARELCAGTLDLRRHESDEEHAWDDHLTEKPQDSGHGRERGGILMGQHQI